jgi:hypothetical protein
MILNYLKKDGWLDRSSINNSHNAVGRTGNKLTFVPVTELFSEPFLRDLELMWKIDYGL